jgi:hypothetical protein
MQRLSGSLGRHSQKMVFAASCLSKPRRLLQPSFTGSGGRGAGQFLVQVRRRRGGASRFAVSIPGSYRVPEVI